MSGDELVRLLRETDPADNGARSDVGAEVDRHALRDDVGNAARFARDHDERLRHVEAFHPGWLVWDGRRWASDETSAHVELAKLTADGLWLERQHDPDPEWRKHAAATRRAGRLRAMLALARSDPRPLDVRPTSTATRGS